MSSKNTDPRFAGAKNLVIGLDGYDVDLMEQFGEDSLPNLFELMKTGVWSRQKSVMPPATLPNWTTFLTGVDPGCHGVFDFASRDFDASDYRIRFTGGTVREAPLLVERLDAEGLRCACLSFPATYPPPALEHGVFMSGWDAPVAFEDDASFVHPASLHAAIKARFGATRFDDVDEFDAEKPGWHDELANALVRRVERKVALSEWLLSRQGWDLFMVYFGESDTVSHHLFAHHDECSPRHLADKTSVRAKAGLREVYEALDRAVGQLLRAAGPGTELTILSDHGSGGASQQILYLNRALCDAGLLTFREPNAVERFRSEVTRRAKDIALTFLSPTLRERVFAFANAELPSVLESAVRFGGIDMKNTRAFSEELNYFPGVWLNMKGRDPSGVVDVKERASVIREVRRALLALIDPWNGQKVVRQVWEREELFDGPFLERAPDLLLDLNLRTHSSVPTKAYSYNLMPSATAPAYSGAFRQLSEAEFHGRKGRSLAGSHRNHGFYLAHGPSVSALPEISSSIRDAAPTMLARMGIAVPAECTGRVLYEALKDIGAEARPLSPHKHKEHDNQKGEAEIERRLRALGYVD